MIMRRPIPRGAVLAAHLLAWALTCVALVASLVALVWVLSLGMTAAGALLPGSIAPDPGTLSDLWSRGREPLLVSTGVAIMAVMGARYVQRWVDREGP